MSSIPFTSVGTGELLPHLRADLRRAQYSLIMVCPWIDEYFAEEVCKASIAELSEVKVLMRPESAVEIEVWPHMLAAVRRIKERFPSAQVRTLERLHAKVIVLDDAVAFIGLRSWRRPLPSSSVRRKSTL